MSGNNILTKNPQTNNNRIDDIKRSIKLLRAVFGDCLNTWPKGQQDYYYRLSRELRQLEHGAQS